jgi:hypothetical protein
MRGFSAERSEAQLLAEVRLEAREDIRGAHVWRLAEQVASRVWVIRRTDLEAWKKELEFCC